MNRWFDVTMIIIRHRYEPEPEHWKFICRCGCEWITDRETEIYKKYHDPKGIFVSCRCPECNDLVYSRYQIDSEKCNKIYNRVELQLVKITKEELH